jgi:hypothetical protein
MFSYIAAGIMIKKNACSQKVNSKELDWKYRTDVDINSERT